MDIRRSIALAGFVALAGCADTPTTPVPLETVRLHASIDQSVVARASGAAHREAGGKPVLLNFSASKRADGTVTGSYYYQSVVNHVAIHVDVTCMTVQGNGAWVAGVISDSNIPSIIGTVSYFYAFDNGEGAGADADVVSLVRAGDVAGEDQLFCDELPTQLPNQEVLHGNVNVEG